jgi:hypothetical protein
MNTSASNASRTPKGIKMMKDHQSSDTSSDTASGVSTHVLEAAMSAAAGTPDPREGRVELAIVRMGAGVLDAQAVAQAMLASVVSDLSM